MVVRLGIVGLSVDPSAWATLAHVKPLTSKPLSDEYKIVAVATSRKETALAAAKAYGVAEDKAYGNAESLAKDPDVDMVTISIKVPLHQQAATPAIKAKKDIFVEWPLGANTKQAEELTALAKENGVKGVVCLQARATTMVQKMKQIIDAGTLGKIISTTMIVNSKQLTSAPEKYTYLNDPNSGASLISIPTIHSLDPLLYLLGEFSYLTASLNTNFKTLQWAKTDGTKSEPVPRNFHDAVAIQGVLKTGPTVTFALNATAHGTPDHLEWIIAGENASLKVLADGSLIQMSETKLSIYTAEKPEWTPVDVPPKLGFGSVGEVYQAFAKDDPVPLVTFEEAVKRHHMVDAIFRSNAKGSRESY